MMNGRKFIFGRRKQLTDSDFFYRCPVRNKVLSSKLGRRWISWGLTVVVRRGEGREGVAKARVESIRPQ